MAQTEDNNSNVCNQNLSKNTNDHRNNTESGSALNEAKREKRERKKSKNSGDCDHN